MKELYRLGKNLKELRIHYGYTQQQVADVLEIKVSSYQAYEWGKAVPTLKNFIKLAKFFDVDYKELLE